MRILLDLQRDKQIEISPRQRQDRPIETATGYSHRDGCANGSNAPQLANFAKSHGRH